VPVRVGELVGFPDVELIAELEEGFVEEEEGT
jgi:hypothetical protein